jgi:hypothetical protein
VYRTIIISLFLLLISFSSYSHEMTPTYPRFKSSFMDGLLVTEMEIFNKRSDVKYYEIGVFDKDFAPLPFVSSFTVYEVDYLQKIKFEVYVRQKDEPKITYICSRSRVLEQKVSNTSVTSTICSKIKRN